MISKYHRTRIIVENDVNCSALAEWHFGNKPENLVNLAIGTGIGVGLILNGQIYRGQNGFAGEVGYWTTVEDIQSSLQHKIGSVGPLEKILSGTAIEGKHGSPKKFFPETEKNSKLISDFIDELVCVIANLISLLDPGLVVLGGGVSMSLNPWLSEINRKVNSTTPCQARIEISSLGENAVALGALQLLGP